MDELDSDYDSQRSRIETAYQLGAEYIHECAPFLLPLTLLSAVPFLLFEFFDRESLLGLGFFIGVTSVLEVFLLIFVTKKLLLHRGEAHFSPSLISLGFLFCWTVLLQSLFNIPLLFGEGSFSQITTALQLLLKLGGLVLGYLFFFFYFPALRGVRSVTKLLEESSAILRQDVLAPLRIVAFPLAVCAFVELVALIIFPRATTLHQGVGALCIGFQEVITTLVGLAFAVLLSSRGLVFSPSSALSLTSIAKLRVPSSSPLPLGKIITLRSAALIFVLSSFLFGLMNDRLAVLPPPGSFSIARIEIENEKIHLVLTAKLTEQEKKEFNPLLFSLGGANQPGINDETLTPQGPVEMTANNIPFTQELPTVPEEFTLSLTFQVDRSKAALQNLEDLTLWYRRHPLLKLDLKQFVSTPREQPQPRKKEGSTPTA